MKKVLLFVLTVIAAYIGFIIGAALNLEGYLGIVFAIAVVGIFILDAIEKKKITRRFDLMKKNFIRVLLLLGYCVPFVFLAMNEDATVGTLWFYLIMIIGFGILSYASAKTKNSWIVVIGNILSFASSCIFAWNFQTPKWEYYFKPFLPKNCL